MNHCKVSMILPVYNVEAYLEECLDSLVHQTLQEIEIIAVNDGSPDHSLEILETWQKKYPEKLKVFSIENHGVSYARNYGYTKAIGEYLWFVDSDDYVRLDACELLYQKATKDSNDLVVFGRTDLEEGNVVTDRITGFSNQNFRLADKKYELVKISPFPWNKLIRRELFEDIHFPEGIRFEDLPIAFLLCAKADSIGVLNECLYVYRKKVGFLGSFTNSTLDILKSLTFLRDNMHRLGLFDLYQKELDYVTVRHFLYRFEFLLTNYEQGILPLKVRLVNELWDYIDSEIPDWQENHYLWYTLPIRIYPMLHLIGSRSKLLRFLTACEGMTPEEQQAWIAKERQAKETVSLPEKKRYKKPSAAKLTKSYQEASARTSLNPRQIFLESSHGNECTDSLLALLLHLHKSNPSYSLVVSLLEDAKGQEKLQIFSDMLSSVTIIELGSTAYFEALAASKYLLTDGTLPAYFKKQNGQFLLQYYTKCPDSVMGKSTKKLTLANMQKNLLTADTLVFSQEAVLNAYLDEYMIREIAGSHVFLCPDPSLELLTEDHRRTIREKLALTNEQVLFCRPACRMVKSPLKQLQAYRQFMAFIHRLDAELSPGQVLYLQLEDLPGHPPCYSLFTHVRPMPEDCSFFDMLSASDVFLTDFHPLMLEVADSGKSVILLDYDKKRMSAGYQKYGASQSMLPIVTTASELAALLERQLTASPVIKDTSLTPAQEICNILLTGASALPVSKKPPATSVQKRVLIFLPQPLSAELAAHYNELARQHPEKAFWIAFSNPKPEASLPGVQALDPGIRYLPIKWKCPEWPQALRACKMSERFGFCLPSIRQQLIDLGKQEYSRYLGSAVFDEVIFGTDSEIETVSVFLHAAPEVVLPPSARQRKFLQSLLKKAKKTRR